MAPPPWIIKVGPGGVADPYTTGVKHDDSVTFTLDGRGDTVTVTFVNNETPLVQDVNGSLTTVASITLSPALTQQSYSIAPNTVRKKYPFTFPPERPPNKDDPDQPTNSGEIDVTTDPEG